jgi:ribosomal protein S18 acetylase RimI-like enzyme
MSSVTLSAQPSQSSHLRPVNLIRDMSAVADLIELCFYGTMDSDGRQYVSQMRQVSRDHSFLHWANAAGEMASMPFSGYVWEQEGRIVGNVSLVPFRRHGKRLYLIANVAVHPDYRQRGIAHRLTEQAMQLARQRKADSIWLHVRNDNPNAVRLYQELGFRPRGQRTTWLSAPDARLSSHQQQFTISKRQRQYWLLQHAWLERLYPDEMAWYRLPDWDVMRPGLWNWLYRLLVDFHLQHWAILKDERLQAIVSWLPGHGYADSLWVATPPQADESALTALLIHIRRQLHQRRSLTIDYPAGQAVEAIQAAGFFPQRTLIWMKAQGSV